jgi:hypothetical protein
LAVEIENPARTPSAAGWSARPHHEDGQRQSLWGTERIRGELPKLGLIVRARSIRRHRRPRTSRPPSLAWRSFLRNELADIWAADLLVVQTLTFKTLNMLFFIRHQRRRAAALSARL